LAHHGKPGHLHTDQARSSHTGSAFNRRAEAKTCIGQHQDGKGAWRDNVFVRGPPPFGFIIKYEEVYLRAYTSSATLAYRALLPRLVQRADGPHSSLDGMDTPSSLLSTLSTPLGSLTYAEAPLIEVENLFRQPGTTSVGRMRLRRLRGVPVRLVRAAL